MQHNGIYANQALKFRYCEISQLLTYAYSVNCIVGERNYLSIKTWNAGYDNKRFGVVYNIDRLAITENRLNIHDNELFEINNLLANDLAVMKSGNIVIDGLYCELKYNNVILNWNTDMEMNTCLYGLVNYIRNFV